MKRETSAVESFVRRVQSRLNRLRLFEAFLHSLLAVSIALTAVALIYVLRGYAVPPALYLGGLGAALCLTAVLRLIRRWSRDESARYGDDFFGLKDALPSALHFRDRDASGEFVELQAEAAAESVRPLEAKSIPFHWPRRVVGWSALLCATVGLLALKSPSPEVLERLRQEEETREKSDEINEHLEEAVETLERSLPEEEREEIDTDRLRGAVEALAQTEDRREAMRQYADLERRVREAARRLEQRRNEQLMSKVGEALQRDPESRSTGRKLARKRYREAAGEFLAMKQEADRPARDPAQQRKALARLRAASLRMASAAKAASRQGGSGSQSASQSGSGSSGGGSSGSGSGGGGQSGGGDGSGEGGGDMEGLLTRLQESVADLDESLQRAARERRQEGQVSEKAASQCRSRRSAVNRRLDELNRSLCKMGARCQSRRQLLSLCRSLGQCQGYLGDSQGQSLSQCLGAKPGNGIGNGSVESRREGGGEPLRGGETTQLQGQKGSGPSTTTVESATSGDGVSRRRVSDDRELEFRRQVESFVRREDVPDDLKEGVKNYFTRIHTAAEDE